MKKFVSLFLSAAIALSMALPAAAVDYGEELKNMPQTTYSQKFSDVPSDYWAFAYISEMENRGILNGYPDGRFYPESQVTRAEFSKVMTLASGIDLAEPTMQIFEDVKINDWYAPYVHTAKSYLSAYNQNGKSYYKPNSPALREDIAVALVKLKGYSTVGADMTTLTRMFSDYQSISKSARIYVATAVENGLISGYSDGTFRGQKGITRAEAATLLWRAYQFGDSNKTYDQANNTSSGTKVASETKNNDSMNKTQTPQVKEEVKQKPEEEKEEEKKPYIMKKLASANVKEMYCATMDTDNNIYYVDESDKTVYKIGVSNAAKSKYLDTSDFSYSVTEERDVEDVEEVTETVETGEYTTVTETVEEEVTETVETGEFEEVEKEVTETVLNEETGKEETVTKKVTEKVPVTKEVTKKVPKEVTKEVPVTKEVVKQVPKTVKENITVAEYTDFTPFQVYYDEIGGKLLLCGYYSKFEEAFKGSKSYKYWFIYDITNESKLLSLVKRSGYDVDNFLIQTSLSDDTAFASIGGYNYPNKENQGITNIFSGDSSVARMWVKNGSALKYGSNLYGIWQYDRNTIVKYNFTKDSEENVVKGQSYKAFGMKKDCYYYMEEDGTINKISVKNGKIAELKISTKAENTDFADMGNMKNIDEKFFVIDDDTLVFYDKNMKAFRILEKQL